MKVSRHGVIWIAIAVAALLILLLLRQTLLPFAVGTALAYLLAPIVSALERLGINRTVAALIVVLLLVSSFVAFLLLMLPLLASEVSAFVEAFPRYLVRIQTLVADANRPWLSRLVGHDLHIDPSSAQIVATVGGRWLDELLSSLWSGGAALISTLSLVVVAPIVAIYLTIDWDRMIATVEKTGVAILFGHHCRHSPLIQRAREIVESGRLGKLTAVTGL